MANSVGAGVLPQSQVQAAAYWFLGFIVTIPFLHALAPGAWLPLPMLYAACAFLLYVSTGRAQAYVHFQKSDVLLAITIALGIAAFMLRPGIVGQKNINHTAALLVSMGIFYFWVRAWMRLSRVTLEQVGAAAALALLIASVAVIAEFVLINTAGTYLSDFIPYSTDELPPIEVLTDLRRPRGLAAEPGFTAMVFESLAPLSWLFLRNRRALILPFALVVVPGFLLLFSAGAIVALCLALAFMLLFRARSREVWVWASVIVLTISAFAFVGDWAGFLFEQVIGRKVMDLVGSGDIGLAETASRYDAYTTAIAIFVQYPLGIGWGTVSEMFSSGAILPGVPQLNSRGVMSLYLEVLVSAGILGCATFVIFLMMKVSVLARRRDPHASLVLLGLLAVMIHHAAVLEFWFPMLWLLLALSDYLTDSRHFAAHGTFVPATMPGSSPTNPGSTA